jgi:hypothetical protein
MIQFEQTNNAKTVRARVLEQVKQGRTSRLLANLDTVTENVYRSLPSGDYGRGDVRRVIQDTIDAHGRAAAQAYAAGICAECDAAGHTVSLDIFGACELCGN